MISFFVVSASLAAISVENLKRNQEENLATFKNEFLELGRELFDNSSALFFDNLSRAVAQAPDPAARLQAAMKLIQAIDPQGDNVIVITTGDKQYSDVYRRAELASLINAAGVDSIISQNLLDQKTSFDFDNFQSFIDDQTGAIVPARIQLQVYNDLGLIVGYGKAFTAGKVRIQYVQRENDRYYSVYLQQAIIAYVLGSILAIAIMLLFMRLIVVVPIRKITAGLKRVRDGHLDTRIAIHGKDEMGEIAETFNTMTGEIAQSREKLEEHSFDLEKQVKERTAQLNEKMTDLERMNRVMVNRELKMMELKQQVTELETQMIKDAEKKS
jgi:methyl-accepting chemotaxis protein